MMRSIRRLAPWLLSGLLLLSCDSQEQRLDVSFVLVGIDGAEWRVIERLWDERRLPHLRELARTGVSRPLATAYDVSPVIWTTIATGRRPEEHGIVGFVLPTPQGDVPITSTARRVPAIWNMASTAGRRVAVLGWWGTWPAESVDGVVVADRAITEPQTGVFPASYRDEVRRTVAWARKRKNPFGDVLFARRDQVMARTVHRLGDEPFDLLMIYFRTVDIVSHQAWKTFEPEAFGLTAAEVDAQRVPAAYEAVDEAIGRIVDAAGPDTNFLVVSDHGFQALAKENVQIQMDLEALLTRQGYLSRGEDGIDFSNTLVYPHSAPKYKRDKMVRFSLAGREDGGRVRPEERAAVRRKLTRELSAMTYENGKPVFLVRDANDDERGRGADFIVVVRKNEPTLSLLIEGRPVDGIVQRLNRISGTHSSANDGILIASGPDVDPRSRLPEVSIHGVTPTVLYGLGLPVAESFAEEPWSTLFTAAFRKRHPLRTIATWGEPGDGESTPSAVDEELIEQLRSLGYL